MPHQRLLLESKAHVIGDGIIDWMEQWLTDRTQRVVIDVVVAELEHIYIYIYIYTYIYI